MTPFHDLAKLLHSYNPDLPMAPGMKAEFLEIRGVVDKLLQEPIQQAIGRGVRSKQQENSMCQSDASCNMPEGECSGACIKKAGTTVDNRAHNHYFKDVSALTHIDVYRVLQLFNVTDPCIQHAVKKLLVAGGRGAGKDISKDVKEAADSLVRWQEMQVEVTSKVRRHCDTAPAPASEFALHIEDVNISTFGGIRGGFVLTADTAVRLEHIPTRIVVACSEHRSAHANKAAAWAQLTEQVRLSGWKRIEPSRDSLQP